MFIKPYGCQMIDTYQAGRLRIFVDCIAIIPILIFLAIPWMFYFSATSGPTNFGNALASIVPIFIYNALPFGAGLTWLVRRYGARINNKMTPFLRTTWLGLFLFVLIAGPIVLLILTRR
jgi:hypothetical protein